MIDVMSLCDAEISLLVSTSELDDPVKQKDYYDYDWPAKTIHLNGFLEL